jgi:hypothetical protein
MHPEKIEPPPQKKKRKKEKEKKEEGRWKEMRCRVRQPRHTSRVWKIANDGRVLSYCREDVFLGG